MTEAIVVEFAIRVVSFVFSCEGVEFFLGELKVKHGEDAFELGDGDLALPELVEVPEELLDPDPLHND